jgi:hypothetical protein
MNLPNACDNCKEGKECIQKVMDEKDTPEWCSTDRCVGVAQGFVDSKGMRYCYDCEMRRRETGIND